MTLVCRALVVEMELQREDTDTNAKAAPQTRSLLLIVITKEIKSNFREQTMIKCIRFTHMVFHSLRARARGTKTRSRFVRKQ